MADNSKNRLWQLLDLGQSVWLDSIRRGQIASGELKQLIGDVALRGETANPSIFEKAIGGSSDYDGQIVELMGQGLDANAIYERLATDDVRSACDVFRPIYDESKGGDGFVSLEVSPKLAYDTEGTLSEVRRFWKIVDRPNLMIKIPGTPAGVPAIEQALYEGMNINITLLFAVEAYEQVAWAYIRALERRMAEDKPVDRIASVASFFVSRIDTLADKQLDKLAESADATRQDKLNSLKGKVAIANARVAYERFQVIFGDKRFEALKGHGARVQRPLWASTSTKNPAYPDTLYVDSLIGPDTINTLPLETILAYQDHGTVARTIDQNVDRAHDELKEFEAVGLSLKAVTDQVLKEGVEKFDESFDKLLQVIDGKRAAMQEKKTPDAVVELKDEQGVDRRLAQAGEARVVERLWSRDASLWSDKPETQNKIRSRLGWLDSINNMREQVDALTRFADEVVAARFKHVLLLGMGGSVLAPEVMQFTYGTSRGHPNFGVLDTTDPATIRAYVREMKPAETLYIVSSKSGTTVETNSLFKFFYGHVYEARGEQAGGNFVAITDAGTPLERLARERKFRRIFTIPANIGGRYAALSYLGLVPAALMGVDLARLLGSAEEMMSRCQRNVTSGENPGLWLGTVLADLYAQGRDKLTLILSPEIDRFGGWAEQLVGESTGKPSEKDGNGQGLVPVVGEPLGAPDVYGNDRVFVYMSLDGSAMDSFAPGVAALEKAGHPVIRIPVKDRYALGGEFFRWQFATAVLAAAIGVNPFDEPNVAETKTNTDKVLDEYNQGCRLPTFTANASGGGVTLYWNKAPATPGGLEDYLRTFLAQARPGDYIALLPYLTHSPASDKTLKASRTDLRARYHVATTMGYGPRYLHSVGQLHKGGPDKGLFIQITTDDTRDASIPGQEYTFGVLREAQAIADLQALEDRGRRVLRLHLASGTDVTRIQQVINTALGEGGAPTSSDTGAAVKQKGSNGKGDGIEASTTGTRTTTAPSGN